MRALRYPQVARAHRGVRALAVFAVIAACGLAAVSEAAAAPLTPAWSVESSALPTHFRPGETAEYELAIVNETGAALDAGAVSIVDSLPAGLEVTAVALTGVESAFLSPQELGSQLCGESGVPAAGVVVSCSVPANLAGQALGRESMQLHIGLEVPPGAAAGTVENLASVEGGGAAPGSVTSTNEISQEDAPPGVARIGGKLLDADGDSVRQAGAVPFAYVLGFTRNLVSEAGSIEPAGGPLRDVRLELPPGLVADLSTAATCPVYELEIGVEGECPDGAAVGTVEVGSVGFPTSSFPLYAMTLPGGAAAALGFRSSQFSSTYVIAELHDRSGGASAWISGSADRFRSVRITLWGDPADPGHDRVRGACLSSGGDSRGSCPAGTTSPLRLRLPTSCELPLESTVAFDTWLAPGSYRSATATVPSPTGCETLSFQPSVAVAPNTATTDSPTGFSAQLTLPGGAGGNSPAAADLRRVSLTLPPGFAVNPAGAGGRVGCAAADVDLEGNAPVRCPDGSRIGTAQIRTPLVDRPISGSVYLASQGDNPFGTLFAVYLVASDEETGVTLKLPGEMDLDPETGQVTLTLDDLPQIPLEEVSVSLPDGKRALLRTPLSCGTYTATSAMRPWSAPQSGPDASGSSSFVLDRAPLGGPCPRSQAQAPHDPSFSAGAADPVAGAFSPLTIGIAREDGSQEIGGLDLSFPAGVAARLAGVPRCAPARGPCPGGSRVGAVSIWAGAGPLPIALRGEAYLSGPYKGAPASLTIEVPAVVGPFDLGTVRSRLALLIDPRTARLRVRSDELPTILSGVPLDLRTLQIDLERPGFVLNPTSCSPARIEGRVLSPQGGEAAVSVPFRVGGCTRLGLRPKLSLRLSGPTHRSAHPEMRAIITPRAGDTNIGRAVMTLPRTELLDNSHIRAVCSMARYTADACPAGAVYGYARAWSPLLDEPLQGPVYLRSSDSRLPDLVASLDGQIQIDLVARVDSLRGRIRNTFEALPDIPMSRLELRMQGGRRGLLVNNTQLCRATPRASVFFRGQNGKTHRARPAVKVDCGGRR